MPEDPLVAIADELYALTPAEFTAARDARARELMADRALSAAVKGLRKPTVAAWVVNLLVRRDAAQVEQVLALGAALREAQAGLAGEELRALTRQRRQLTGAVAGRARGLAAEYGQKVTDSVAEQVEATLTAALVDAAAAEAVRSGLLLSPLSTTGVDAVDLTGALAVPGIVGHRAEPLGEPEPPPPPDLRVVPDPDAGLRALEAARDRLAEASTQLARARSAVTTSGGKVAALQARSLQLQAEIEEHRRAVAELEDRADSVDEQLTQAERIRADSEAELATALRERDSAAAAVAELES